MSQKEVNKGLFIVRTLFGYLIGWVGWYIFAASILGVLGLMPRSGEEGMGILLSFAVIFLGWIINHKYSKPKLALLSISCWVYFFLVYALFYPVQGTIFLARGVRRARGKGSATKAKKDKKPKKAAKPSTFKKRVFLGYLICLGGWICWLISVTSVGDNFFYAYGFLLALLIFVVGIFVTPSICRPMPTSFKEVLYYIGHFVFFPVTGVIVSIVGSIEFRKMKEEARDRRRYGNYDEWEDFCVKATQSSKSKPQKDGGWKKFVREIKDISVDAVQTYASSGWISGDVRYLKAKIRGKHWRETNVLFEVEAKADIDKTAIELLGERGRIIIEEGKEDYKADIEKNVKSMIQRLKERIKEYREENYKDMFGEWNFNYEITLRCK